MNTIKNLFNRNVKRIPTYIMGGGLCVAVLSLVACVVSAQRNKVPIKPDAKEIKQPVKPNIVQPVIKTVKPNKPSYTITEIEHDKRIYLLIEKNGAIAIVRK